ncbi:MAG: hypothetical protein ABI895_22170 [Deltaproteobacteria bacterium]
MKQKEQKEQKGMNRKGTEEAELKSAATYTTIGLRESSDPAVGSQKDQKPRVYPKKARPRCPRG